MNGIVEKLYRNYKNIGLKQTLAKVNKRIWLDILRPSSQNDMPRHLRVDTSNFCNLDCEYCVLRENVKHKTLMEFDNFKKLAPVFKYLHSVSLSGLAEPLVNKNIEQYIKFIKDQNRYCTISIFSNLTLLTEERIHTLVSAGLDQLLFSIDDYDPEVNDNIRKNSSVEKIFNNLRLIKEYKEKHNKSNPFVMATTVLQKKNYKHLPELIKRLSEVGVKQINVNGLEVYDEEGLAESLWLKENTPDDLITIYREASDIAERNGMVLRIADLTPLADGHCADIEIPHILPNGDLIPCSVLAYDRNAYIEIKNNGEVCKTNTSNNKKVFGNVFEQGFNEVWRGREYSKFRDLVISKKFPHDCKTCLLKHKVICVRDTMTPEEIINNYSNSRN